MSFEQIFVLLVLAAVLFSFFKEIYPPEVTALGGIGGAVGDGYPTHGRLPASLCLSCADHDRDDVHPVGSTGTHRRSGHSGRVDARPCARVVSACDVPDDGGRDGGLCFYEQYPRCHLADASHDLCGQFCRRDTVADADTPVLRRDHGRHADAGRHLDQHLDERRCHGCGASRR